MAQDDVLYSMRAIGFVDYVASENTQTTPVIWFASAPWWQHLSFHDHPPLVFIVQWLFFQVFGVSVWVARLPFVLVGLLSVWAIYRLGKQIWSERVGLLAAAVLALANYTVWISRIGYLDGFLVLWICLALDLFLRARERPRYYLAWGVVMGAGLLTKYTFIFLLPAFLIHLIIFRRHEWRRRPLYFGTAISFLMFLPVIIYNIMLWQTRGHFDLALSAMLGQHPADYKIITYAVGGTHWFLAPVQALLGMASPTLVLLVVVGVGLWCWNLYQDWRKDEAEMLLVVSLISALALFFGAGGSTRFGAIILPVAALAAARTLEWLWLRPAPWRSLGRVLIVVATVWEIFFMTQSQLLSQPIIDSPLLLANTRPDRGGYRHLDDYIGKFLSEHPGKPISIPHGKIPQLAAYVRARAQRIYDDHPSWQPNRTLLVFDEHLEWFNSTWIFERRALYNVAPVHPLSTFISQLKAGGVNFYQQFGFQSVRVIVPTANVPHNPSPLSSSDANAFLTALQSRNKPVEIIRDDSGLPLFNIYEIPLAPSSKQ
jgi:hypothetical protein